ncbi:LysR family transcriptional regulator [Agromyces rhizosphaerae]|uniref:LysR family transcriptional regulator n=1 Tax=Agromyces rhizosphaerae TaxID=88374 RepID=A0A9W6FS85_9MICO|nr:LysR family transcriptional regulator [Agromyces rhizosphaerae]GLI28472.1 LysR family transcriptional regulator [Agromyces rhizosphaerae]
MDVELRHLRALIAVDEERSFTDAADELGLSQAAVSRTVAALEHELGVPLLHRTTRRVEPTDAGEAFLVVARRIVGELDRAVAGLRGEATTIRVGYAWAALGAHTTPVLREWNRAHADARLRLVRVSRAELALAEGRIDLAVVRGPLERRDLRSEVVGTERRVVALPVDHALAFRASVTLADLTAETLAIDPHNGTTRRSLWTDAGLVAPTTVETDDVESWLDLIAAGEAVGVTAEATAEHYPRPGVAFVPISDAPTLDVRLAWLRAHPHDAAGRLARAVRAAYGAPG